MDYCPHCGERLLPEAPATLRLGRVTLDTGSHELLVDGESRHLPRGRFAKMLETMMRQPGRVFTAQNLMDAADIWAADSATVRVYVYRIRRVLGDALEIRNHHHLGWSLHLPTDR